MKNLFLTAVVLGGLFSFENSTVAQNFITGSTPHVGTWPMMVVSADVNNDGKPDLISANNGANTLMILTNNGNGGFVASSSLNTSANTVSVTTGDVNGDGKVDLISANYDGNGVSTLNVFTNNGVGGFVSSAVLPVAGQVNSVVAAALITAGRIDLICQNASGNTLTIMTNNGHGVFTLASSPSTGSGTYPSAVTAADVNGDGKIDLISANFNGSLTVLTNNGKGVFTISSTPSAGSVLYGVTAADVNGDGKIDLISADEEGNSLEVLTNNGSGNFVSSATLPTGNNPWSVVAADVNGDGRPDLISADFNSDTLSVFTNSGSGHFVLFGALRVGNNPAGVTAVDVNGDDKPDLICANETDSTLSVLINDLPGGVLKLALAGHVGSIGSLSWPIPFGTNYILQTSTNLASANWLTASNGATTKSASAYSVMVTNLSPARFFRLQPK